MVSNDRLPSKTSKFSLHNPCLAFFLNPKLLYHYLYLIICTPHIETSFLNYISTLYVDTHPRPSVKTKQNKKTFLRLWQDSDLPCHGKQKIKLCLIEAILIEFWWNPAFSHILRKKVRKELQQILLIP